jgi:hypothetical protein
MQKLKIFIFICCFSFLSYAQTSQPSYEPFDLIGTWEYNIPNTQEYIQFTFFQSYDYVNGDFKKISKDLNGNVVTEHFNSETSNHSFDDGVAAMEGIHSYNAFPEPNTFGSMFADRGITNNNLEAKLYQICTLKIYKSCVSCDPEIHFTLLPKNPGVRTTEIEYEINIPVNMVLTKVM